MKILSKALHTLLIIMSIIAVIPGTVTVLGFIAVGVGHFCFGYSIEQMQWVVDAVNGVWHFYGIF